MAESWFLLTNVLKWTRRGLVNKNWPFKFNSNVFLATLVQKNTADCLKFRFSALIKDPEVLAYMDS